MQAQSKHMQLRAFRFSTIKPHAWNILLQDNESLRRRLSTTSVEADPSPAPEKPKPKPSGSVGGGAKKGADNPPPQTEGAKENRLRRLCERKPSGRINVPDSIHEQWAKGGAAKRALRDELERVGWDKDCMNLCICVYIASRS